MKERKLRWHKIAENKDAIDWKENNMAVAEAGGKKFTLTRSGAEIYACAYTCPHAGGILSDGYVDAVGNIVCPLHRYKFSLVNGRNVSGEGYYLKVYAIEEREAGIFVGIDESSWLEVLK